VAAGRDADFITSTTPDVLGCLRRARFFEQLDDAFLPADGSPASTHCKSNFGVSEPILRRSGFDLPDLEDIFGVLRALGGHCDCEILYNVAETSRLKEKYWKEQYRQLRLDHGTSE
jgi:hypothetical protein